MKGIKQQTLPQALWNLDRIDKRSSAFNSVYRQALLHLLSACLLARACWLVARLPDLNDITLNDVHCCCSLLACQQHPGWSLQDLPAIEASPQTSSSPF